MTKTRIGISASLLGAVVWFSGMLGGITAILLAAGYILLMEEDQWPRKTALRALVVTFGCSVAVAAVSLLPQLGGALQLFSYYGFESFVEVTACLATALTVAEKVILLVMGIMALLHKTPSVAFVEKFIDKSIDPKAEENPVEAE